MKPENSNHRRSKDGERIIGAVYTTLARLEEKKLVSSYAGSPTPERGGRSKRFYRLEATGQALFQATIAEQDRLRQMLPGRPVTA